MHCLPPLAHLRRSHAGLPARALLFLPLFLPLLLAACSPLPGSASVSHSAPRPTHNYVWFVAQLRATGATVSEGEALPPSTDFRTSGRVVHVNGERVDVREYDSPRGAEADLGRVGTGGQAPATALSRISGDSAQPVLYETDILLVFYTGKQTEVTHLLTRVLGPPVRNI